MTAPSRTAESVVAGLDLGGRTFLVTGATSGLGRETARVLALAGGRVVLAGRDPDRLAATERAVLAALPGARVATLVLDLASLASVRGAAQRVLDREERLDVLVNNGGVMFTPPGRTVEGFETQIGTNHLGPYLFTRLLEPLLVASGESRVVTLSSGGHKLGDVDLDDLCWRRRPYDKFAAYGASKTANVLFTVELDRRWRGRGVRGFAVHPGVVATDLARHMDAEDGRRLRDLVADLPGQGGEPRRLPVVGVDAGAATSVWAATAPALAGRGGCYLEDCAPSTDVRSYAVDPDRARRLWAASARLVGLPDD